MLIEFSVTNFRSFREKQTLSMVAASRLKKKVNTFTVDVVGDKLPELLKVAAIYGPNASGKTSLIKALDVIYRIASRKPSAISEELPVTPFRFDPALAREPSEFEVHFVHKGLRYEFGLAATSERIVHEHLIAFPNGKESLLYDRTYSAAKKEQYVFGEGLEGGLDLHLTWQNLTNPQVLFIAQAVANSSENLLQLKTPFEWLMGGLRVTDSAHLRGWAKAAQDLAKQVPRFADDISLFLQDVDVPVTSISFDPVSPAAFDEMVFSENKKEKDAETKMKLTHRTALGEAKFEFDEESSGTQNLIGFWLPWSVLTDKIDRTKILVVDELDSSLHPKIVADLIHQHLHKNAPGQLIFTTHDTHLMDTKLLRRDQIWIAERDLNGATKLRSVHDFEGREGEDIEKRYYEGRYRGLPILGRK